ncbi:hypothetical protein OOJ09_07230 [Mesorhizobium qingshengii]|uniref:Uncharacterized protein n=1 Tax=Mesorhizobium qingshengii TaxID=1165689 RepID=A0ABT4QQW9_9HYPH|nr:hypothetical protein [Mesorhizobium qingshengii]MCZ8543965.1 hypothetical protein [Mesorhizobium qingshengii]
MAHPAPALFAFLATRLRLIRDKQLDDAEPGSPAPVRWDAERDRLPPRDESFYWAWQYWSQ